MAFRTLFRSGYQAFIAENRDRDDLWFFVHIPKTAGSSFRAELETILTPDYNIHVYDDSTPRQDHRSRMTAAVQTFVDASWRTRFRFASGHVPVQLLGPIHAVAATPRIFTMLRDPVARVVSDYRYQTTAQHPDHRGFRARFPTIDAYLAEPGEGDKMMRYLSPAAGASVAETVDHTLDTFAFVGTMEHYAVSFRIMMDLLGVQRAPSVFLRRTGVDSAAAVDLTDTLAAAIRDANPHDVALYEAFRTRLGQVGALIAGHDPAVGDDTASGRAAPAAGFAPWRYVA